MFFVKRFGKITLGVLIFIAITVEWRAFSLRAGRLPRNVINVATNLSVTTGDPARMVYKATSDVLAMNAEMFGQWTKNNSTILQTDNIVIGGNREKKRFWLRIKSVHMYDAGLYSFKINGTVVGQWKLQVQDILDQEPPCGEPLPDVASVCVPFNKGTHPKCLSFPGAPLNMQVSTDIYKGRLVINVTWKKPNNGLSDLWGYQVHIAGRDYHPGYSDCGQVNSKDKLSWFFEHVRYGATYQIMVQSMPAHHTTSEESNLSKMVFKVQEKCQFPEYIHTSECCTMNITSEYKSKQIHLKWTMPPREECQEIQTFAIQWNNIQKPEECNGEALVTLSGKTNKTETKVFKFTVLIPPKAPNPRTAEPAPDNFKKILIAVFGSFLGLLICTILVMYRIFFQQVKIQLPVSPPPRPHFDDPLLESDKKRVFIMHTRCCEKCSYAVHCFGAVLNSTDLIEASIDMWSTLDIAPNVPRWYEDQVKNSHCVVVLASNKMSLRCQNAVEEGDDPLNIKCQLNLVRGNIAQNPDVRRFIPAFFTCSGSKKNIPEFLTSRWSHKLPKDIDRVIFHLLNVEKIQPYRTQPIIVMGGNGHPFDERKKEFERAVQEAELYHKKNNNLQNGNAYLIT